MFESTDIVVTTLGLPQLEVSQIIDYTYDPLNRLTGAAYSDGSFNNYTYDALGNRLTETPKEETDTSTYNANNWIVPKKSINYSCDRSHRGMIKRLTDQPETFANI